MTLNNLNFSEYFEYEMNQTILFIDANITTDFV
jgi:hypothetical protein